jgi:hypothetical protein
MPARRHTGAPTRSVTAHCSVPAARLPDASPPRRQMPRVRMDRSTRARRGRMRPHMRQSKGRAGAGSPCTSRHTGRVPFAAVQRAPGRPYAAKARGARLCPHQHARAAHPALCRQVCSAAGSADGPGELGQAASVINHSLCAVQAACCYERVCRLPELTLIRVSRASGQPAGSWHPSDHAAPTREQARARRSKCRSMRVADNGQDGCDSLPGPQAGAADRRMDAC